MTPRTPRQEFVLAMREMWAALCEYRSFGYKITHEKWMRQASDAFADAAIFSPDNSSHSGRHSGRLPCVECRAALWKEIAGE